MRNEKWLLGIVILCCMALLAQARGGKVVVKHTVVGSTTKGQGKIPKGAYDRLVTYGKSWVTVDNKGMEQHYYLSGDTTIGEWFGLKLYLNRPNGTVYQGTLCEEGLQAGLVPPGERQPWLMYDFDMKDADAEWIYCPLEDDSYWVENIHESIENNGIKDLTTVWGQFHKQRTDSLDCSFNWIEGIGSCFGILSPCFGPGFEAKLLACYDVEKCLYKDGKVTTGVDSIGFLACKEVGDIPTFKCLYNGTESTLTLASDTVFCVKGDSIILRNAIATLVLYKTGLNLQRGHILHGTITGRKEWIDGRPVLMATDNTSDKTFTIRNTELWDETDDVRTVTAQGTTDAGTVYRLDGVLGNRRGIVIKNRRKIIIQ